MRLPHRDFYNATSRLLGRGMGLIWQSIDLGSKHKPIPRLIRARGGIVRCPKLAEGDKPCWFLQAGEVSIEILQMQAFYLPMMHGHAAGNGKDTAVICIVWRWHVQLQAEQRCAGPKIRSRPSTMSEL